MAKAGGTRVGRASGPSNARQATAPGAAAQPAATGAETQGLAQARSAGETGSVMPGRGMDVSDGAITAGAGNGAHETFAALDSATGVGAPSWVHAGGRQAEAGFQDPALGWVGVRADVSAGGVHASLMAGSAEAAQVLSAHLPGLGAYLNDRQAPVSQLSVATSGTGGQDAGSGQSAQQDARQDAAEHSTQGAQSLAANELEMVPASRAQSSATETGMIDASIERMAWRGGTRGVHISVMA